MSWLKTILILILVLYLLVGLFLFLFQERLIFRSTTLDQDYEFQFDADFDEINLEMDDGAILNALHFQTSNPKGIILYFHGNAGDLSRWGEVVLPFLDYNYDVLIVDYRGYGKSTGNRTRVKMYRDAESVYAFCSELFSEENIVVYGRSLGGTFATHVASTFDPKLLILESPFFSVADVAKSYAWMYPLDPILKFNFRNWEKLENVSCPITIVHGTEDMVVPIGSGKKLSKVTETSNFHEISGGGHNDLAEFKEFWDIIQKSLN